MLGLERLIKSPLEDFWPSKTITRLTVLDASNATVPGRQDQLLLHGILFFLFIVIIVSFQAFLGSFFSFLE